MRIKETLIKRLTYINFHEIKSTQARIQKYFMERAHLISKLFFLVFQNISY